MWWVGCRFLIANQVSPDVAIWLDEFNWGGNWADVLWPDENHGGLRGIFWASYILAAIDVTERAQAAGRTGYDAMMSYSLFYQNSSDWSQWASCAAVPDQSARADLVQFDGVAQIFAHFSQVALSSGYTDMEPVRTLSERQVPTGSVPGGSGPCILAARFSTTADRNGAVSAAGAAVAERANATIVAVNVCPFEVAVTFPSNDLWAPAAAAVMQPQQGYNGRVGTAKAGHAI
jgi:hypothetical protein